MRNQDYFRPTKPNVESLGDDTNNAFIEVSDTAASSNLQRRGVKSVIENQRILGKFLWINSLGESDEEFD